MRGRRIGLSREASMEPKTFELSFAKFIEKFHDQIKESFFEDVIEKRELLSGHKTAKHILEELADSVLGEFTKNIDRKTSVEVVAERYSALGKRCRTLGLRSSEMVRVITLLKRHIWLFFQDTNFAGQPFDVRSIVAINNRTALFFDRAIFYFLKGFEALDLSQDSETEAIYRAFVAKLRRDLGLDRS
jgi:hypothetical protein